MNILITGGTGYIGSHIAVQLLEQGHEVIIIDNLVNSDRLVIDNIAKITGKEPSFYQADVSSNTDLDKVFSTHSIDAVIHCAGLKSVAESVKSPLLYYKNNVGSTLVLLESMAKHDVRTLIFSSSATVYGDAPSPYTEASTTGHGLASPYAQTKYMIECILSDAVTANKHLAVTSLRYFNPIGAHPSGLIGERPSGTPNNLMPYITQVATGERDQLSVFGDDYDTPDGTGVRDYIHVDDVATGHLAALSRSKPGYQVYNLGSGKGTSVLELITAFEKATNQSIPYTIKPRRAGDLASYYADVGLALEHLEWQAHRSIEDACSDAWKAQKMYSDR